MKNLVIDIGGTFTKYAVMDEEGAFLSRGKIPTVKTSEEDFVESLVGLFKEQEEVTGGIAVSCAGFIDSEKGLVHNAGSLYCVHELPLAEVLTQRCQVPAVVGNDARCAAMAELWKGSLRDCRNAACVVIGTAVGGTVIVDRKVLEGRDLMAGEFSYILANAERPMDPQYNYALYGGMPALIALASDRSGIPKEELSGERIFSLVREGNAVMRTCVREYCRRIAVLILNLQFVVNPDRVAVGGGVSAEPLFVRTVQEELSGLAEVYPYKVPVPEVCACSFHNDANLLGALYLLREHGKDESSAGEGGV